VSNHLQNAYTKLGITKRTELAAALGRLGEPGGAP
jgi:DNA-binding CsgD family transcriptional regulator